MSIDSIRASFGVCHRQGDQRFLSGCQRAFLEYTIVVFEELGAQFLAPFGDVSKFAQIPRVVISVVGHLSLIINSADNTWLKIHK